MRRDLPFMVSFGPHLTFSVPHTWSGKYHVKGKGVEASVFVKAHSWKTTTPCQKSRILPAFHISNSQITSLPCLHTPTKIPMIPVLPLGIFILPLKILVHPCSIDTPDAIHSACLPDIMVCF